MSERDVIVAWLRGPVWHRMGLLKRLHMAVRCLIDPADVVSAVTRNLARSVERGDHLKGE